MNNPNLVLRIKASENGRVQVKVANRIVVDGSGRMLVYLAGEAEPRNISFSNVHALSIQGVHAASSCLPAQAA